MCDSECIEYIGEYVHTFIGPIYVARSRQVGTSKAVLVTMHDLWHNHQTNFTSFFQSKRMRAILKHFNVIHINAPGQECRSASAIKTDKSYASFDEMVTAIRHILQLFQVEQFLGFAVGAGANILIRYSLQYGKQVAGLFLVNASFNGHFPAIHLPNCIHFIQTKFGHFNDREQGLNMKHCKQFFKSYLNRTPLILNEDDEHGTNINCPVVIIAGKQSCYYPDSKRLAQCLKSSARYPMEFITIPKHDSLLITSDKHDMLATVFHLFSQGLGYLTHYPLLMADG